MSDALSNAFAGIRDAAANFEAAAGRVAASGTGQQERSAQNPAAVATGSPAAAPVAAPSNAGLGQSAAPSAATLQLQETASQGSNLAADVVDLKSAEVSYKANALVAASIAETEGEVLDTLS